MKYKNLLFIAACALSAVAHSQTGSATACLKASDPSECLIAVATTRLKNEKSSEERIDGYASLITSLAKSDIRKDDLFNQAIDDESAPAKSRWSLMLARKVYATRFNISNADIETPQKIENLANSLRAKYDGIDRMMIVWDSCEAREGEKVEALKSWGGVLDRLCKLDASDVDSLEKEIPGMSAMTMPMIDAYNRDERALSESIQRSLKVLDGYQNLVEKSRTKTDKEAFRGIIAMGHWFNAIALATSGSANASTKAMDIALAQLSEASIGKRSIESQLMVANASWIYAKAGAQEKAKKSIGSALKDLDKARGGSVSDRAAVIGMVIEALHELKSQVKRSKKSEK